LYSVEEARAALAALRPALDELVVVRADLAELSADAQPGAMADLKAAQARFDELLTIVVQAGVELKGVAPLLLDFPADFDGVPVLLCWLEGDQDLGWYHRTDLGFLGRRPLP
jgi:hypothetical protein